MNFPLRHGIAAVRNRPSAVLTSIYGGNGATTSCQYAERGGHVLGSGLGAWPFWLFGALTRQFFPLLQICPQCLGELFAADFCLFGFGACRNAGHAGIFAVSSRLSTAGLQSSGWCGKAPSLRFTRRCCRSSVVEHSLGKGEVEGPIPSGSTSFLIFPCALPLLGPKTGDDPQNSARKSMSARGKSGEFVHFVFDGEGGATSTFFRCASRALRHAVRLLFLGQGVTVVPDQSWLSNRSSIRCNRFSMAANAPLCDTSLSARDAS
jgi:hypothetical protein